VLENLNCDESDIEGYGDDSDDDLDWEPTPFPMQVRLEFMQENDVLHELDLNTSTKKGCMCEVCNWC
jgi:hypothetical protein